MYVCVSSACWLGLAVLIGLEIGVGSSINQEFNWQLIVQGYTMVCMYWCTYLRSSFNLSSSHISLWFDPLRLLHLPSLVFFAHEIQDSALVIYTNQYQL